MIFVDTSFFYALVAKKDRHHEQAIVALTEIGPSRSREVLLTTNSIISETLTLVRQREGHQTAVGLGRALWGEQVVSLHRVSPEDEVAAFEYFEKHADQD